MVNNMFYPEKILDIKYVNNNVRYLIKWKGYKETTWEPHSHISHRTDLIEEYKDSTIINNLCLSPTGYIYCRVSSKSQSKYSEGHTSLEVQEKECTKFCLNNDVKIIETIKESYSARNMNRMVGLKYLLNKANKGQTIYVYDISRFSRNVNDALNILNDLCEKGITVYSITEKISYNDPNTRNQFRLQLCASNYVSDICSAKVKASIQFRRNRGDYIGSTPYGYTTKVNKKTQVRSKVVDKREMKIIKLILMKNKKQSLETILNELIENNITFRGRRPTISGIKRIIKNNTHKKCGKRIKKCGKRTIQI